jgi:hypothetical protein
MSEISSPGVARKALMYLRIWRLALSMEVAIRRHPLPRVVEQVGEHRLDPSDEFGVGILRRAVDGSLRIGRWQPRCLVKALVLYRLLRERGISAELVIGLPDHRRGTIAHAWVEVDGHDVGPRPGRSGHEEFARFGAGDVA